MLEIVNLLLEDEHSLRGILNKYERTKNENELEIMNKSTCVLENIKSIKCKNIITNCIYFDYNDLTYCNPEKQNKLKYTDANKKLYNENDLILNSEVTTKQVIAIKLPYFRHCFSNSLKNCNLPNPTYATTTKEYIVNIESILQKIFDSIQVEMFVIIDLDEFANIKDVFCASIGTVQKIKITQSKIPEYLLIHDSTRIVIAHNHPSDVANPSIEDTSITRNILLNCAKYDIELCDHIIYGKDGSFSFKKSGLLDKIIDSTQVEDK